MNSRNITGTIIFVIAFAAVFNLLDFLYMTFIAREAFSFTFGHNVAYPCIIAVVACLLSYIFDRRRREKDDGAVAASGKHAKRGKHERQG